MLPVSLFYFFIFFFLFIFYFIFIFICLFIILFIPNVYIINRDTKSKIQFQSSKKFKVNEKKK